MNIINFLDEAGGSRLKFQLLPSCVLGATKRKTFTEVRFGTEAIDPGDLMAGKPKNVGVIVWIPIDDYERAVAALREGEST